MGLYVKSVDWDNWDCGDTANTFFIDRNREIGAEHNKNVFLSSLVLTQECQRSLGSKDASGRGPSEPEVAHEFGGFRARETLISFLGPFLLVSRC